MNQTFDIQPRIHTFEAKKLVGKRLQMSLAGDRTPELWRSFMPHRSKIKNVNDSNLYCLQVYDPNLNMSEFDHNTMYEKWSCVSVDDYEQIPEDMEILDLPMGLYAIFDYKGRASDFGPFSQYIFTKWLPNSEYVLDQRPHFDILGAKYKNNEVDSEEEICIPIRMR